MGLLAGVVRMPRASIGSLKKKPAPRRGRSVTVNPQNRGGAKNAGR